VKTVHREFFPIFALLESPMHAPGVRVVAQRKLLHLEKLFAALLLGAPRLQDQLKSKIEQVRTMLSQVNADVVEEIKCKKMLNLLVGLQSLLSFYLPAVFRAGYLVRCCTWEGRASGSGSKAKQVLEDIFVLLVHLLQARSRTNEYVRTIAVALITWQPFMSKMPGVCFAEESCEAMLSRMSHRCEVYRHLHGLDATFNLFLTLPMPSRIPKGTRGGIKQGLVSLFASRIRKIIFCCGDLPYAAMVGARQMHSVFESMFPENLLFAEPLPKTGAEDQLRVALQHAMRTLLVKANISPELNTILTEKVPRREPRDAAEFRRGVEIVEAWNRKTPKAPKPKPKLMPKPKARRLSNNFIFFQQIKAF
jgi:hypothetical protein